MKRKKGFTLVELLVVIAIIAMLLAILMPALNKVRLVAARLICGTNLGGLGKAIVTYAADNRESYPLSGNTMSQWDYQFNYITNPSTGWDAGTNPTFSQNVNSCNITSALYLLVKYADVGPGSFICKASSEQKFTITNATTDTGKQNYTQNITDITQAWDFGSSTTGTNVGQGNLGPWNYCSYAYQQPFRVQQMTYSGGTNVGQNFCLSASSAPGLAVMADANPWFAKGKVQAAGNGSTTGPYLILEADLVQKKRAKIQLGNSTNHSLDGQNVLYCDGHTNFEVTPIVGIDQDNIYTAWTPDAPSETALAPNSGGVVPNGSHQYPLSDMSQSLQDSFLAN